MKLNKEEKALLAAYGRGEMRSVPQVKRKLRKYSAYAKAALVKNKRINIRLSEQDLLGLQMKAMTEGLPYQTLISSILHKYVSGSLKEAPK